MSGAFVVMSSRRISDNDSAARRNHSQPAFELRKAKSGGAVTEAEADDFEEQGEADLGRPEVVAKHAGAERERPGHQSRIKSLMASLVSWF